MRIDDKRTESRIGVEVGDILDIEGFGLRMIVQDSDSGIYNTLKLETGLLQIEDGVHSIKELLKFYDLDRGRSYSIIKSENITITFEGKKGN